MFYFYLYMNNIVKKENLKTYSKENKGNSKTYSKENQLMKVKRSIQKIKNNFNINI